MVYVGIDWSELHHDICVMDGQGAVIGKARVPEGIKDVAQLHHLVAEHADDPESVW